MQPPSRPAPDIEVFRQQAHMVRQTVRVNVDGVTHDESLVRPSPGGNCLNWVVGHLLCIYDVALPMLGQEPVMGKAALSRYDRGAPPLQDPAQALAFETLVAEWNRAVERVEAGLAELTPEFLDRPAAFSPTGDPNETNRSLLTRILFHQGYHAGQTGVLRRIAGKAGAIA